MEDGGLAAGTALDTPTAAARAPYAQSANRARTFRDFLAGYAGAPKHRAGPYDRPDEGVPFCGGVLHGVPGMRAIPGSADDPTMEALVSRTLYICKLPPDCTEEKLRELAEPFGDIRKITLYPLKQIAFLEYWDIRSSEKARSALKTSQIGGRKIHCQFSHARNDRARDGNTGTLYIRPVTSDRSFVDPNTLEQYHTLFGAYGEIKKVSSNRKREAEKFMEYYDLRSAEAALNAVNGKDLNGVVLEIQFANQSSKTINQDSRLTERRPSSWLGERESADSATMFNWRGYPYDDGYGPRGAGGYPPAAAAAMMSRVHPYAAAAAAMPTHVPPGASAPPIDPYGYAPPPMMGVDAYWSYVWASQAAAAAAQQQPAMTRAPPGAGRGANPYRT